MTTTGRRADVFELPVFKLLDSFTSGAAGVIQVHVNTSRLKGIIGIGAKIAADNGPGILVCNKLGG